MGVGMIDELAGDIEGTIETAVVGYVLTGGFLFLGLNQLPSIRAHNVRANF